MVNEDSTDVIVVNFPDVTSIPRNLIATSYHISRDFFGGAATFTLEFEDDRADALLDSISVGSAIHFYALNSGQNIMIGFVDSFDIIPSRASGKRLSIRGRDRLGMLNDASLYPNLGQGLETYHFKPTDTLEKVIKTIFSTAPGITNYVINEDAAALTGSTGFGVGVRQKGKTGRGLAKSFKSNLNHLLKPEKGETYLGYAQRICKRAGCQIMMMPGSDDTLFIGPPTYDRVFSSPFKIYRTIKSPDSTSNTENNEANVLDSRLIIDFKDQPTIIIAESTHGDSTFKKITKKVVCANEFTAYEKLPNMVLSRNNTRPSVKHALDSLTSGTNGYTPLEPNQHLYNMIPDIIKNIKTLVSRPKYITDYNSQTEDELKFFVAELMAHYQDKYFTLEYTLKGHSQKAEATDAFFAPNLLILVIDESFHSTDRTSNIISQVFWIRKVEFMRDRHNGATTKLTLNLPYIHLYDITK